LRTSNPAEGGSVKVKGPGKVDDSQKGEPMIKEHTALPQSLTPDVHEPKKRSELGDGGDCLEKASAVTGAQLMIDKSRGMANGCKGGILESEGEGEG